MVPKRFTLMNITEMNFNNRELDGCDRISYRHARMGIGGRIEHNAVVSIECSVNRTHHFPFTIKLGRLYITVERVAQFN